MVAEKLAEQTMNCPGGCPWEIANYLQQPQWNPPAVRPVSRQGLSLLAAGQPAAVVNFDN
jgi:hypothetical protein